MKVFRPTTGGHPARLDDLKLLQDAYYNGFKALASFLDSSLNVILSGVTVTDDGVTVNCTDGYASWQGEFYEVLPASFSFVSGGVLFLSLVETILPPSPVTYEDTTIENVHFERKLQLVYYSIGTPGEYLSNFSRAGSLGVRAGTVVDWFGNLATEFDATGLGINTMVGYAICNGIHNTPDLRGLFTVGATNVPNTGAPLLNPAVGTYNFAATGGAKDVALTIPQMPSHSHNVNDPGHTHTYNTGHFHDGFTGWSGDSAQDDLGPEAVQTGSKTTGITLQTSGSGQAHENRPPFFALIKIMKL